MKKISYSILLCFAAMAAGCHSEKMVVNDKENEIQEVFASTEDMTTTKTYMDGTEVLWSSGDQIVAFLGNNLPNLFRVNDSSAGSKEARFQKDNSYVITGNNVTILNNVAYYPFSEDIICTPDGSLYKLDYIALPSVQTYSPNSAGNGTYPMVAVTTDTEDVNYRFRNVCGAIMFQLKGSGTIKSISIKGNSEEVLCGSASVTASYGKTPSIVMSSNGGKIVTLECGTEGVELSLETPTSFIISLPPVPFTNGFTINVTDISGGTAEYCTSKKNSILRSTILRMPVKEYTGKRLPQEGDYIDEYGINHGQGVEIDGVVWAPVNCGYKAATADSKGFPYGKLYQWGRKYGQGCNGELRDNKGDVIDVYSDSIIPTYIAGPVSIEEGQSINNSNIFYTYQIADDYRYDWSSTKSDILWNLGTEDSPIKTEYDPCPEGWRVPTYAELNNLQQNHSPFMKNAEGFYGYWFSGSTIYSDKVTGVFLSAAGGNNYDGLIAYRGGSGFYRSSSASNELYISTNDAYVYGGSFRSNGESVRCVQDDRELIPVSSLTLSESSLTLNEGDIYTLSATIVPSNANHQSARWWSDDESIATVDQDGKVTALSSGTATVTAMAGMQTATCKVTITVASNLNNYIDEYGINHGKGVEIDGVVWAPVNCGYHKDNFKYGKLYQWGRKYGQGGSADISSPRFSIMPEILDDVQSKENEDIFLTDWPDHLISDLWNSGTEESPIKTEYDPCPSGWRVPTSSELDRLLPSSAFEQKRETNSPQEGVGFNVIGESGTQVVFLPFVETRGLSGEILSNVGAYNASTFNPDNGLIVIIISSINYEAPVYEIVKINGVETYILVSPEYFIYNYLPSWAPLGLGAYVRCVQE